MKHSTPGKDFEADVIGALRREQACEVFTSETMDLHHKVDGEIRAVGQERLEKPVQMQITRRINHFGKLNSYLATRWLSADVISLYVEVHPGPSAHETAEHVAWAAREAQGLAPYGKLPVFGLRINDDAAFFDPRERLRELDKERSSPEHLAALKAGTVFRFDENGFWIMDEDFSQHFAHYVDATSSELRAMLRSREARIPVRFFPTGLSRATDVRLVRSKRRIS